MAKSGGWGLASGRGPLQGHLWISHQDNEVSFFILFFFLLAIFSSCSWLLPSNALVCQDPQGDTVTCVSHSLHDCCPGHCLSTSSSVTCSWVHTQPQRLLAAQLGHSVQASAVTQPGGDRPRGQPHLGQRHLAPALLHLSLPQIKRTVSSSSVRSWA